MRDKVKLVLLSFMLLMMIGFTARLFINAMFPIDTEQERMAPVLEEQRKNIAEFYKDND